MSGVGTMYLPQRHDLVGPDGQTPERKITLPWLLYLQALNQSVTNLANAVFDGSLGVTIDGGGKPIVPGAQGFFYISYPATIVRSTLLASDPSATPGSIVLDVWKAPYAAYPPVAANSIVGPNPPTLVSANKSQDTALVGWTVNVAPGDIMSWFVRSASSVLRVTHVLTVVR